MKTDPFPWTFSGAIVAAVECASLRLFTRPKRSAKSLNVSAYHLDRRRLHGPSGSTILTMRKPAWAGKPPRPSEEVFLNGLMVC